MEESINSFFHLALIDYNLIACEYKNENLLNSYFWFLTLFSLYKQELKVKMEKRSPFKGLFKECKRSSYKPSLHF